MNIDSISNFKSRSNGQISPTLPFLMMSTYTYLISQPPHPPSVDQQIPAQLHLVAAMDFHSLTRRELQSLCKKNKIPANITNVAMADALKALKIVEGIEEFLNPSESETAQSSIDSPEKSEVTSPFVPRTGGRTTRRKPVKDEVENSHTLTRARRSTRKLVVGEVDENTNRVIETPAGANSRRAPVASAGRKMDTQLKEVEEDQKMGKKDISETPGLLPASRRRGLMGDSTVRRVYGTRRSTRLAEKNMMRNTSLSENEKLETVKNELFSEESGENLEILEMNVKECSDDMGEIIETTDIDLKEQLEACLERNHDKEVNSDKNFDCLVENQIQFDKESRESFAVVEPGTKSEDDGVGGDRRDVEDNAADDLKAEVYSEICEEIDSSAENFDKPLEMADKVEKSECGDLYLTKTENALDNGDKLDANEEMVSENIAAESLAKEISAHENDTFSMENETAKMSEEILDFVENGDSGLYDNLSVNEEVLEKAKKENDTGFKDGSADDLEANKYSEDLAAFDINLGGLDKEASGKSMAEESLVIVPKNEEQGIDLVSALESMTLEKSNTSPEESTDNNLIAETIALELNASADVSSEFEPEEGANSYDVVDSEKPPTKQILGASDDPVSYNALPVPTIDGIGEAPVFNFTEDPSKILSSSAETELSHTVLPTSLTPLKKSASKNPEEKTPRKTPTTTTKLSHTLDDEENIDNSGTILIRTEKKKTKDVRQTQYVDVSLRKLRKELKEKLEITKNLNKDEKGNTMMTSRPALQALSENILADH